MLAVKGKYILPINNSLDIIEDGMVIVEGSKITAVGKREELEAMLKADRGTAKHNVNHNTEVIDAGNSIVMPGLINTHAHAAMAYFRGLADDLPLDIWLGEHIWPAENKYLSPEFVKQSGELAILEMIKSGTTCFNDMYLFEDVLGKTAEEAGIRAMIGSVIFNFPCASSQSPEDTLNQALEQMNMFKGSKLATVALDPHAIYTCAGNILQKINEISKEKNAMIHIHLSETEKEVLDCKNENGKTPVEYLNELGLLSPRLIIAHAVWLSDNDLELLAKNQVKVAHCPVSNKKLASGIAPIAKMLEKGIAVGLGTDGAASNNTLDMFSDMRITALLHKVSNMNPTVLSAREVVKMATIEGARVLGMDQKTGSLEPGKLADIITINLDKPHLQPIYDPYSHLAYCVNGADVENSIINGKVVMRNREVKTLNEDKILKEAREFKA